VRHKQRKSTLVKSLVDSRSCIEIQQGSRLGVTIDEQGWSIQVVHPDLPKSAQS
jgi:hypothetical protein